MARLIGAVVLGYLALAFAVFAGLSAAYLALGPERAFQPGVYAVSVLWAVTSLVLGFGAGALGGWVSRAVARSATGPRWLAGVVVVLGFALALPVLFGEPAPPLLRAGAVGILEAMQVARTPAWILLLNPIVGALGVLVGGRALGAAAGTDRQAAFTT